VAIPVDEYVIEPPASPTLAEDSVAKYSLSIDAPDDEESPV
jgi:hypothetical protein